MNGFAEPFQFALAHWAQIILTICGCALALGLADEFDLHRPWPLPVILGGILSLMIMEAFPYAWMLGKYTGAVLWVVMAGIAYCMPLLTQKNPERSHKTLWDYFTTPNEMASQTDEQRSDLSGTYQ